MNKLWILILYLACPLGLLAQQSAAYNKKGDEAMKRQDYSDAKMWYEEGVSQCDPYSIRRLTAIWLEKERMRPSMRSLMNKCLNCLNVKATENDTAAVVQLITYYAEGIGTPKNDELATYWQERLQTLRRRAETLSAEPAPAGGSRRSRMEFFAGYAYAVESPYGLTVGGMARRVGWYVRFKTNMSFQNHDYACTNDGVLTDFPTGNESYSSDPSKKNKINSLQAMAGMLVKCTPWLYVSTGLGYGQRELLHPFATHSKDNYHDENAQRKLWAKNMDSSYTGIAAEADLIGRWHSFFLSAGCNTINFKYIDLNMGVGMFF